MARNNELLINAWNKLLQSMTSDQIVVFMLSTLITFTTRLRDALIANPEHECATRAHALVWRVLPWLLGTVIHIDINRIESGHDWVDGRRFDRGLACSLVHKVRKCRRCGLFDDGTTVFCPGYKTPRHTAKAICRGETDFLVDRWVNPLKNQAEG